MAGFSVRLAGSLLLVVAVAGARTRGASQQTLRGSTEGSDR